MNDGIIKMQLYSSWSQSLVWETETVGGEDRLLSWPITTSSHKHTKAPLRTSASQPEGTQPEARCGPCYRTLPKRGTQPLTDALHDWPYADAPVSYVGICIYHFITSTHFRSTTWLLSLIFTGASCVENFWLMAQSNGSPGGNTPQSTNYTTTNLPSRKLSKLGELDMQDTAGEAGTSS